MNADKKAKMLGKLNEPAQPVITQVVRVEKAEELVRINGFDVPADLARRLRINVATTGKKQREILIEALDTYLPK